MATDLMTWIQVADDAVKIGLGAAIAGLSGFLHCSFRGVPGYSRGDTISIIEERSGRIHATFQAHDFLD